VCLKRQRQKYSRISLKYRIFFWSQQPPVGQGLLIHEVSRSHTTTQHSRQDSSGRVISPSQRPLPDTQRSKQTNNHAPGGFRIHNLSRRAAADLRLKPLCRWDWPTHRNYFAKKNRNVLQHSPASFSFQGAWHLQMNYFRRSNQLLFLLALKQVSRTLV